jgi:PEP-CTERM motif
MKKLLFVAGTLLCAVALRAQSTNTLAFNGTWNDGGSLAGWFTVAYDVDGTPIALLAADITTGNSTPGFYSGGQTFAGYQYIYNVNGQANTAEYNFYGVDGIDTIQSGGDNPNDIELGVANQFELNSLGDGDYQLYLDWQGSNPATLYLGTAGSGNEYSSETYDGAPTGDNGDIRYLNTSGGAVEAAPEPGTFALAGLGGTALLVFLRRRQR